MGFDVNNRRLDGRGFEDLLHFSRPTSDNPIALHLPSSTSSSSAPHVQTASPLCRRTHIAVRVPRVLLISRLEGERGVDEIEIDVVELEFLGLPRRPVYTCSGR